MQNFEDGLIKDLREEVGACNQTTLTKLAVKEFLKKYAKPDGKPNVKNIGQVLKANRGIMKIQRLEEQLKEEKIALAEAGKNQK